MVSGKQLTAEQSGSGGLLLLLATARGRQLGGAHERGERRSGEGVAEKGCHGRGLVAAECAAAAAGKVRAVVGLGAGVQAAWLLGWRGRDREGDGRRDWQVLEAWRRPRAFARMTVGVCGV